MTTVAHMATSPGKFRSFVRLLWAGTLLVNLFVIGMVALVVEKNRAREALQAAVLTENYSRILEEDLAGFISKIDMTLLTVSEEVARQTAAGGINGKALEAFLSRQDSHIPEALGLRVVDARGIIRYAVNDVKVHNASIADRPQFIRLRDDPAAGLVVSKPVLGRAAQKWMITLGRRINNPDGSFGGDVHVAVAVEQFINMFSKIDLGASGNIGLWDKNSLIARYTKVDTRGASVGATTPSATLRELLGSGQHAAAYHARSGVDGVTRSFYFRQVAHHPLYLVVGLADEDYLAQWRSDSLLIAGLAGLFVVATLFSSLIISRGWKRREANLEALRRQETEYTARLERSNQEAESARRQSQMILDSAGEGICGVDLAGQVVFVNPAARAMFGWKEDEGIGEDLHALTHHHQADGGVYPHEHCAIYRTLGDGARRQVHDDLYWRKDGSCFPVEFMVTAMEQEGRVSGAVNVFRDITERKQIDAELLQHRLHLEDLVQQRTAALLETEARASHILESSADGLYGVDANGLITFINPAACALLGYAAEQAIGRAAHTLFHYAMPDGSPYPATECPSHGALQCGREVRVDTELYWHADGHGIPVMYAIHPMTQNGKVTGAVTSFVDMTGPRAVAQAREQALIAAENLVRLRSEFLANMSHEIRTPLNGVLGFANIGLRNSQDGEKARSAFTKILNSGTQLLGVINDILDFSKVEAGKLSIEHVEIQLAEVVEHAVEVVRERARCKGLALRVELPPDLPRTCIGDPLRLGQVLLNLLSNAVKFTEVGQVSVTAACHGDRLVFRVADTGVGMNAQQLGLLFNPFQQADGSTTRRFGGTGLGLAISKRILQLMGGDINVESQPGLGSAFEFQLPYVQASNPVLVALPRQAEGRIVGEKPLAGLSILVAEDDAINQMIMEEILTENGARVVLVGNGLEAVDWITQDGAEAFDIVLMDLQMPVMDGFEATRRILALAPALPIIGQTAHAFKEEKEKCFAAGMVGHIAKPIDPDALVALLLAHLSAQAS